MKERSGSQHSLEPINHFMGLARDDHRINMAHISLYVSLMSFWDANGQANPISVFSREVMPICKISGSATYHRCMRQLHEYGYIRYVPSFNRFVRSLVYINT